MSPLSRLCFSVCLLASAAAGCEDQPPPSASPSASATATSATTTAASAPSASASAAPSATALPPEPMGDASRGKELAKTFECHRCHGGLDLAAIDRTRHCVQCHQDVLAGKLDHKPDAPRWRKNVAHLSAVPSLQAIGKRMQYGWLVRFLAESHDLRPALVPTMPRLALGREQARDIAAYLVSSSAKDVAASESDPLAGADEAAGRKHIDEMQCGSCHAFTGVAPLAGWKAPAAGERETRPAVMLAPDLRHARERVGAAQLIAWLLDPLAIKSDTLMPKTPMTPEQARDIAAYILRAKLKTVAPAAVPAALPPLDRRVTYEEVAKRVLDVTCRHCHGDADMALGDGGPGNTGGFGFKPRGINFTSYEHVLAGYLDDAGERHSMFAKMADGTPRLVAALWARHREVAGNPDPSIRGMPLGLPPLPAEDIQLLATWIAQGRPR